MFTLSQDYKVAAANLLSFVVEFQNGGCSTIVREFKFEQAYALTVSVKGFSFCGGGYKHFVYPVL